MVSTDFTLILTANGEIPPINILGIRNKIVADIGCGAGSFSDHISGLAEKIIAIEPTVMYQKGTYVICS